MKTTKTNKTWPKRDRVLCNGTRGLEFLTRPLKTKEDLSLKARLWPIGLKICRKMLKIVRLVVGLTKPLLNILPS